MTFILRLGRSFEALPHIIGEIEAQSPKTITIIDDFLHYNKTYIASKITSIYKDYVFIKLEAIL